jgi:hypothetical protein
MPEPHYPLPWGIVAHIAAAAARRRTRTFRPDALDCVARLRPPLRVLGSEHAPAAGPGVLTVNHYARPGFGAQWLVLALSATVPAEIHWVTTAALTFPGHPLRALLRPLSRVALRAVAGVYGFTTMPPMPPSEADAAARAQAVRALLAYARATRRPLIGLAPEGRDLPGGVLGPPPPGSGRFVLALAGLGLRIAPVGAYEQDGALCLSFGPAYALDVPAGRPGERDRRASRIVMQQIARQLPVRLRGAFAEGRDEASLDQ